jgi:hypothetical protein
LAWGILTSFKRRVKKAFAKFGSYPDDSPPNGSKVNVSDDASVEQMAEIKSRANTLDGRNKYGDAPDAVVEGKINKVSQVPVNPEPEHYHGAYFPAGGLNGNKRPNISAIRIWVAATKVGLDKPQSYMKITEEAGEAFGYIPNGMTKKAREYQIDKITYLVARKIWYVGRKPAAINDVDWDKMTKHMRPAEGTFHHKGNDEWGGNFPYGETYKYRSGYVNQ